MKKDFSICNFITAFALWVIIAVFGIGIFILPQKDFSKSEGRMLAAFPEISLSAVIDKSFFEKLGDFYSDQLPLRQALSNVYAICELSLGKQEVNQTVVCSNGALVMRNTDKNEKSLEANLNSIEKLSSLELSFVFFSVPEPSSVFIDSMPLKAQNLSSRLSNECYDRFLAQVSSSPADYYYLTDHHWTTRGAYLSYSIICEKLGLSPYKESFFEQQIICDEFYGSAARRSSLPHALINADNITLYRYDGDNKLLLTDCSTGEMSNGLYAFDELNSGDQYRVFLGGNSAHVSIRHTDGKERPRLLILKDSYANSLVPFLALHYDIDMIDPRYAEPSQIKDFCVSGQFDTILALLCESTLKTESSVWRAADIICEHAKRS